jgi:hypothetical protein
MTTGEFVVYLLWFASLIFSLLTAGMLARVRYELAGIPRRERRLLTILTDSNLAWCATVALTGVVVIVRVLGYSSQEVTRYGVLVALCAGSLAALLRLGHWFLAGEGEGDARARRARTGGIPDLGDERDD